MFITISMSTGWGHVLFMKYKTSRSVAIFVIIVYHMLGAVKQFPFDPFPFSLVDLLLILQITSISRIEPHYRTVER